MSHQGLHCQNLPYATFHLDGDVYRANLRPCPEHYCENKRARVRWKEMVQSPSTFFEEEDLPPGILLRDPSHLHQEEVLTLWDFLASRQKDGHVGLIFSGWTHEIKEKTWGWGLPGRPRERG